MSDVLLSFERDENELEIHCNDAGIDRLINVLNRLKGAKQEHIHLFTEDWGGADELTNDKQNLDEKFKLVHKVTVRVWNN